MAIEIDTDVKLDRDEQRMLDTMAALLMVAVLVAIPLAFWWFSDAPKDGWAPYWVSSAIGVSVGMTELIGRYRDSPFAPLFTVPGVLYCAINGAAAWLAYHLIKTIPIPMPSETAGVLTAGIAAMALFRSGLFTARLGDADVQIGPNIILGIFLTALDRTYDRMRAAPRSMVVADLMQGLSFAETSQSLPAMCFKLMQNVSDAEKTAVGQEVQELADSAMSDEAKSMNLGLALFNVVGERTLRAAIEALGSTLKGFKQLSDEMVQTAAQIDPALIISSLPQMCNELAYGEDKLEDPAALVEKIVGVQLDPEAKVVLVLYKLVRHYGETTVLRVLVAMS